MNIRKCAVAITLGAFLSLSGVVVDTSFGRNAAHNNVEPKRLAELDRSPDFSLVSAQGELLTSEHLRGRVILLHFWATGCAACIAAEPELRRLYQKNSRRQLVLISISSDQNEDVWRDMITTRKMNWPQFLDRDEGFYRLFKVGPIPTYIVIDRKGDIRRRIRGWGEPQAVALRNEIEKCLEEVPTKR